MSHRIRIHPSGHEFVHDGQDTILRSGLASGLDLFYNCLNGSCGQCYARLLEGRLEEVQQHDYPLSNEKKSQGWFLACCHRPLSDLVIEMYEVDSPREIPYQEIQARISRLEPLTPEVMQLQVRTPRSRVLEFMAGQKVELMLEDGRALSLGIASCPCDAMNLRFHVTLDEPAMVAALADMKKGQSLLLRGPQGEFTYNEEQPERLVFVAWHTGFSQVMSLVDHVISMDTGHTIDLLWFSDTKHYLANQCRAWADAVDDFSYQLIECSSDGLQSELDARLEKLEGLDDSRLYAILPENVLASLNSLFDNRPALRPRVVITEATD